MFHIRLTWQVTMETDLVRTSADRQHTWHGCGSDGESELGAEDRDRRLPVSASNSGDGDL